MEQLSAFSQPGPRWSGTRGRLAFARSRSRTARLARRAWRVGAGGVRRCRAARLALPLPRPRTPRRHRGPECPLPPDAGVPLQPACGQRGGDHVPAAPGGAAAVPPDGGKVRAHETRRAPAGASACAGSRGGRRCRSGITESTVDPRAGVLCLRIFSKIGRAWCSRGSARLSPGLQGQRARDC